MIEPDLATRQPAEIRADPTRVIVKLFVPGRPEEHSGHHVVDAVDHILGLDEDQVAVGLAELFDRFSGRHRDLLAIFDRHAERVADRIPAHCDLSRDRRLLLGAAFTHEYSVEAASVCNPSFIPDPNRPGASDGIANLVMSTRGIGEGHRSSIGFREVRLDQDGTVTVAAEGSHVASGAVSEATLDGEMFRGPTRRAHDDTESTSWVLDQLGEDFTHEQLRARLAELEGRRDTRPDVDEALHRFRSLADRTYRVEFDPSSRLTERVLYPFAPAEQNGMEDARFVRLADDDGQRHLATYTAYDGTNIVQQLLETADFCRFEISPLQGPGARNKGLALFPRRIGGRYAALSRHDGATNAVAFSDDLHNWPVPTAIARRPTLRSSIQVGNCGPPIETDSGWLVLTHGVGPMRTYTIGACLLDLDDPTRVIAELPRPLLSPQPDEQDGYVPNVVYSCGAVIHGPQLVIPFGVGDASIKFANVALDTVLDEMI